MGKKRRTFLKCAAAATAAVAAGLAASPAPWEALRQLKQREHSPPDLPVPPRGQLAEQRMTSAAGPCATGVTVLCADGRPLCVRADTSHPLGRAGLTPPDLDQVLALGHPARLLTPQARGEDGVLRPIPWSRALEMLRRVLADAGHDALFVSSARPSCLRDTVAALSGRLDCRHQAMPSEAATARNAAARLGLVGTPGYDVHNARNLVVIGADMFGAMPASPHLRRGWAEARRREGTGRGLYFGPAHLATAALCDTWTPLAAGQEALAALAVCWHLDALGLVRCDAPDVHQLLELVRARFAPDRVQTLSGLKPEALRAAALALAEGGLLVAGASSGEGAPLITFHAALAANALAGRLGAPGGVRLVLPPPSLSDAPEAGGSLLETLRAVAGGASQAPAALVLVEADPVGTLPDRTLVARAVAKAGFKACFATSLTATAALCDLVLPASMPLERFDDVRAPYGLAFGVVGLARPLVRPAGDSRHPGDVLAEVASMLGHAEPGARHVDALRRQCRALERAGGYAARDVAPWQVLAGAPRPAAEADLWRALSQGLLWVGPDAPAQAVKLDAKLIDRELPPDVIDLERPLRLAAATSLRTPQAQAGLAVQAVASLRPDECREGRAVARVHPASAKKLRLVAGGRALLKGYAGQAEVLVELDDTVMEGHVALLLGLAVQPAADARAAMDSQPAPDGARRWDACRVTLEAL